MYHRNAAISSPRDPGNRQYSSLLFLSLRLPPRPPRMFLKEFDIEFFPSGGCHQARELCFPGNKRGKQRRRWRRVHYLEVERNPAAPPPEGGCFPRRQQRRAHRQLTIGTAELRRRIITFYADFNTPLHFPSWIAQLRPSPGFHDLSISRDLVSYYRQTPNPPLDRPNRRRVITCQEFLGPWFEMDHL